jgi:hypothetical protein
LNYFNYFSEVEETFIRRRGKSLLLSSLDWTLIESWQKRGIPLHIVIRSVEKIFDDIEKEPRRSKNIKSIAYCGDEVERQYRDWLASQAGAAQTGNEEGLDTAGNAEILSHLSALIEAINAVSEKTDTALRPVLSQILKKLEKLRSGTEKSSKIDAEKIEAELTGMETMLDKALLENTVEKEISAAGKEVEMQLGQYAGRMQQDVYEKTFELMLIKKLRAKAGLPAFSLFYL